MNSQKRFRQMVWLSFAAVVLAFLPSVKTNAADLATPTGLYQDAGAETVVRIVYEGTQSYANYDVQISTNPADPNSWTDVAASFEQGKAVVKDLQAGSVYYVRVRAHIQNTESVSEYTDPYKVVTAPGELASAPTQTGAAKNDTATISYGAAKGAVGYDVLYISGVDFLSGGTPSAAGTTSETTFTIKGLKKDNYYIADVAGYVIANEGTANQLTIYGEGSTSSFIRTLPAAVTALQNYKWDPGKKDVTVAWKNGNVADGYEVVFSNSKGKKAKTADVNATNAVYNFYTYAKGGKNTFCSVKARAYVKVAGKKYYSSWTKPVYLISQPQITKAQQKAGLLYFKWNKVNGATGYDIYVGLSNTANGYKKVKSVGKNVTSYKTGSFKGSKISYYSRYYFYVVAKKKVGGKTYKSTDRIVTSIH